TTRPGAAKMERRGGVGAGGLARRSDARHRRPRGRQALAGRPIVGGTLMARGVADVRLVDPTAAQLVAALRKAHATANRGLGNYHARLERNADFWGRFARDCLHEREGRRRSCKAGYLTPEVIAAWWTDPAGRRHVRVVGRTRGGM